MRPPLTPALLLGLVALVGCAPSSPQVSLAPAKSRYGQGAYEQVLTNWTRKAKIIQLDRLDTTLRVHATCLAPDFIAGYVARYEHLFKLPGRERRRMSEQMNAEWSKSYGFVVGAATTDAKWNDFDKPNSIWRLALINDLQQQVAPLEVKAEKVITATIRGMYPYVGDFFRVYTVRFPRKLSDGTDLIRPKTRHMALRFAGPLGKTELVWRLQ